MLYNKRNTHKVNDKKILHKIGKQWKVVSLALLMAIGGATAVSVNNANANASTTTPSAPKLISANPTTNSGANNQMNGSANNSANSNGLNSKTASEVNSLEAPLNISGTSNSNNNSSSNNKNTSSSANNNINIKSGSNNNSSNSASSSVSVSYQNGFNGSAASYHAAASKLAAPTASAGNTLKQYLNSLNSKFPTQINSLKANVSNANTKLKDAINNGSFANSVAHLSNRSALISNAASANFQTVSDFTQSILDATNYNSANVSASSGYASYANEVASYAQLINEIETNPAKSEGYKLSSFEAKNNYALASARAKSIQSVASATSNEMKSATNASFGILTLQTDDHIALINSQVDSLTVHSLANKLGYNNNDLSTKLGVQSAAKNFTSSTSNVTLINAKGSKSNVSVSTSGLYQALSDTNVMDNYASNMAKLKSINNYASISANNSSANAALTVANSNLSSAQSAMNADAILANNPNYSSIFKAGLVKPYDNDQILPTALSALASASNSNEKSAAMSALNSDVNLITNSAKSATSASASYANNSDVTLIEAPSEASSANSNINTAKSNVQSASSALNSFMNSNTSNNYTKVSAAYQSDSSNLAQDTALAEANGMHVYNYAPKYISNMHRMLLHQHTNYQDDNASDVQMIPKGSNLQVLGVGFAQDGTTRYVVSFNGKRGYVTANPSYVKPEYLMQIGKHVTVNVIKNAMVYDNSDKNHIGKVRVGDSEQGTVVSEPDGNFNNQLVYGAFTRIKLDDGNYLTANTNYVSVVPENNNNNNSNNTNNNKNNNGNNNNNNNNNQIVNFY